MEAVVKDAGPGLAEGELAALAASLGISDPAASQEDVLTALISGIRAGDIEIHPADLGGRNRLAEEMEQLQERVAAVASRLGVEAMDQEDTEDDEGALQVDEEPIPQRDKVQSTMDLGTLAAEFRQNADRLVAVERENSELRREIHREKLEKGELLDLLHRQDTGANIEVADSHARLGETKRNLDAANRKLARAEGQLKNLREENGEFSKKSMQLKQELDAVRLWWKTTERSADAYDRQILALETEVRVLQREHELSQDAIAREKEATAIARQGEVDKEQLLQTVREKMALAEANSLQFKHECEQALSSLEKARGSEQNYREKLISAQATTASAQAEAEQFMTELDRLRRQGRHHWLDEREKLKEEIQSMKRALKEERAGSRGQFAVIHELDAERSKLKEYMVRYESELRRYEKRMGDLVVDFKNKETDFKSAEDRLRRKDELLQKALNELDFSRQRPGSGPFELENEAQLRAEVHELRATVAVLRREAEENAATIAHMARNAAN